MKVFLSWSGARSKAVAELLDDWLRCVLQAVDPWISARDIDRGALWFSEINDQLKEVTAGIVCLTRENKDRPWILFEAGALARGLSSQRVMTFLIDLKPTDIRDPLAQFNHTLPDFDGLRGLVSAINLRLGERAISERIIEKVFNTYWPQFEAGFAEILSTTQDPAPAPARSEVDKLDELLEHVRRMERLQRAHPIVASRVPEFHPKGLEKLLQENAVAFYSLFLERGPQAVREFKRTSGMTTGGFSGMLGILAEQGKISADDAARLVGVLD